MGTILHEIVVSFGHLLKRLFLWIKDSLHPIGWKLALLYGFLVFVMIMLSKNKEEKKEKSLAQNIGPKLAALLIAELLIVSISMNWGPMVYLWKFITSFLEPAVVVDKTIRFPWWWVAEFVAFGGVAFLFFVLIDMPYMKEQRGSKVAVNLLVTYFIASGLYTGFTIGLPQFEEKFEIAELEKVIKVPTGPAGPETIKAGKDIFSTYKCFNCHKVWEEGSSDRGPNLGSKQIGLYSEDYIKEQIVAPQKIQAAGFTDEKSKTAMPDYYGEDITKDEMTALVAYLKSMVDPNNMPVEGKLGEQWTWWDDPQVIEEGRAIYEGANPAVNCSVCHGKDGTPPMTGAFDFRDANRLDTAVTSTDQAFVGTMSKKPLKDWTDDIWIARATSGIPGSAMAEWKLMETEDKLLKAAVYARTFHDPLDKRGGKKRPLPEVKSPESFKKNFQ